MGTTEKHIIKDFMVKRSRMRGQMKLVNYKSRWFILTPTVLRYHDGSLETGVKKEKGRLELPDVVAVEEVDADSLEIPGEAFQVVYNDRQSHQLCTLYVITTRSNHRDEWIKFIREASESSGAEFAEMFHPGVYNINPGRFTCCYNIDRYSQGCQKTTFCPSRQQTPKENGTDKVRSGKEGHDRKLPPLPPDKSQTQALFQDPETKKVVIAVFDYDAKEQPGDMSLKKGEHYKIIDDTELHWLLAINPYGEKGYIPANYVEERTELGLESYDWYYHGITRSEYEDILRKDGREGCFLVRDSREPGCYAVSVLTYTKDETLGSIHHYHIKRNEKKEYYLHMSHPFRTLPELISFHKRYNAGLCTRLQAIPTNTVTTQPPTAGFGHGMHEIDHKDLEFCEDLGAGQFATVKKAVYIPRNQEVAVKMLKPGAMSEDKFIAEAIIMQQLQHKNLVQLYGVCTTRPIYLITEFMKNGSLRQYLRNNDKKLMHGPVRLDMCIQVCSGMVYLESKQYLHRDLAARNCLVGENNQVKVGDFGLARFVEEGVYNSSKGSFPVRWAAPEVLNFLQFSIKSDVWAFGVLMWEVYTLGKLPYFTLKNTDVIEHVKRTQPPLHRPDKINTDVYNIMKSCWEKNLDDRPSFKGMFEKLKELHPRGYEL
ncbi:hypothetical protein NP493_115g08000 [Ridgeia piscesae]|uniref:Tyrosine-protein kinase n=1 Tax=Ridgeia piscesae TaxID=27915 RepID=A0AAD9P6J2_RIDPI|nr:hypothetical protein NP493_115g08000 [Ridgeia piscesae]